MHYLIRTVFILFLIFSSNLNLYGQSLEIKGRVIDSSNKQPISYALIRVKNSSSGTTSNVEGNFYLSFPQLEASDSLVISILGYHSQIIAIKDLSNLEINTFQMMESVFQLEEVEVILPDVEQLIKEVSKRIGTMFPSESIVFEGFYRKAYREFGLFVKQYEAAISGFDNQYNKKNGFVVSRLKVKESKDFRENKWRQSEGNVPWHYLWQVRQQHLHYFNSGNFKFYHYTLEDIIFDNGERIYKIQFKLKDNPSRETISWVFVRESDLAILEIGGETTILNPKMFKLSDSLMMDYTGGNVLVKYIEHEGKLYPAFSRSSYNHRIYNQKSEFQGNADMHEELYIHEVTAHRKYTSKNSFLQDQQNRINALPTDSIFWNTFNSPLESTLSRKIIQDLAGLENNLSKNEVEDWNRNKPLSPESLNEDFGLFQTALKEAHPSLYRFTPKEELDNLFETTRYKLIQPMDRNEFFRHLTPILAKINCGHTQGFLTKNHIIDGLNVILPIQVKFISGKLFIWKVLDSNKNNLEGMEITAINNIKVDKILEIIFPHLSGDGYITTSKERELENNFVYYYEQLIGRFDHFELILNNSEKDILHAISDEAYSKWKGQLINKNEFHLLSSQTGILKIRTFMNMESFDFESWLEDVFLAVKDNHINHLIIDLRGNEGGNDLNAINLLKYLVKKPFNFHRSLHSSTNQFTFLSHTENESLNSIMSNIVKKDSIGNFMLQDNHPTLGIKNPYPNAYNGKIYFLINGKTFSTAADFAAVAREYQLGLFIGEETGGTAEGNTSNGEILLNLPNSKIRIVIPLFQIHNAISKNSLKGRGVIPDIQANYEIADFLKNKDIEIDIAMNLVNAVE